MSQKEDQMYCILFGALIDFYALQIHTMGCQLSSDEKVHVVIAGGGFGGIAAAQHLKRQEVPFMLISPLDAFHHNVASLCASVQSGMLNNITKFDTLYSY